MLDPRELPDNAFSRIFYYLETGEYEDRGDDEVAEDKQDDSTTEQNTTEDESH